MEGIAGLRDGFPRRQFRGRIGDGAAVSIASLTVAFDGACRVLHGVDLALQEGEALGLVGESGSGKTVTWLAALGLLARRARVGGAVRSRAANLVGAPSAELDRCAAGGSP